MKARPRRSRCEWERLIIQQEESGQTQKEFCRRQRISFGSFKWWRNQIKRACKEECLPSFVEVKQLQDSHSPCFEIERHGTFVRVPQHFDKAALANLLEVL